MSRPLRVLVWTENHWIGGCDRFLVDLVQALDERDAVDVTFAGNPHPAYDRWLAARLPDVLPRQTVPVANLVTSPLQRLRRQPHVPRPTPSSDAPAVASRLRQVPLQTALAVIRYEQGLRNLRRLTSLLRRHAPDVVHINNGGYPGGESCRWIALAARRAGVPRVVHFVHNMAYPPAWPAIIERLLDRRVDAAADAWVTAAQRASAALTVVRGLDQGKVHTVHYGIPSLEDPPLPDPRVIKELGFRDSALNIAVVAAFEPRKGHATLIDALGRLAYRGAEMRVAFVGAGPEEERVRARVTAAGLDGGIVFAGWRDDVDAVLAASDALVLPSLSNECLPYAILEAMEHGLPVVSTDVAGIPELIADGVTGCVVPPGDSNALAEAIGRLADDPAGAAAMGAVGRERRRRAFGQRQMAEAMLSLWRG